MEKILDPGQENKTIMKNGKIHLYTGNGKGKTTAALGLALRAAGHGLRSLVIQFMKGRHYSELTAAHRLKELIRIEQYGSPRLCLPQEKDLAHHRQHAFNGLERAGEALSNDPFWDLVILDEIVTAVYFKLITEKDLFDLTERRRPDLELVLTGRYASAALIHRCHLVTEMVEIRHYYQDGVEARPGIEM